MVAGGDWQLTDGCEEVEEEGAPQCGDVLVLCLWLNVEPVRLESGSPVGRVASPA